MTNNKKKDVKTSWVRDNTNFLAWTEMGVWKVWEEKWRKHDLVEVEESDLLVTNSDLGRALWAALASYRLLSLWLAHDCEKRLQQNIQQALHHHLHLLLHWGLLQRHRNIETDTHSPVKEAWIQPVLVCSRGVLIFSINSKDIYASKFQSCYSLKAVDTWLKKKV